MIIKKYFHRNHGIEDLELTLSRAELIQRSRILFVDDEHPPIIEEFSKAGFAIDYMPDIAVDTLHIVESLRYNMVVLDYYNVGRSIGSEQGLALLRHIKRVNPSIIVVAYTSRALTSAQADFYRLSDLVLHKDAGIAESLEKVEQGLKKALSIQNMWSALLNLMNIQTGSELDVRLQKIYLSTIKKPARKQKLQMEIVSKIENIGQDIALGLIEKLIELGIKAVII